MEAIIHQPSLLLIALVSLLPWIYDYQAAGFPCVMMSGSGTSIFAMGMPSKPLAKGWAEEFAKANGVSVWETTFCARSESDANAWYPSPY